MVSPKLYLVVVSGQQLIPVDQTNSISWLFFEMCSYNHLPAGVNHTSQTRKLYLAFLASKLKHVTAKLFTLKCVTCSFAEFPENAIMLL